MNEAFLDALLARQNDDGGWGALEGAASDSECTALAVLALHRSAAPADPLMRGEQWLIARQESDGAWRYRDEGPVARWSTPIAILALRGRGHDAAVARGLDWLVELKGERLPLLLRIREFLSASKTVDLDTTLDGWPWAEGSFAWVEPTSWALIAMKTWSDGGSREARARIREGEQMLLDRACPGGGWNYGNKRVLDVALEPYPDTTALALMALYGRRAPEVDTGFVALDRLLGENASGLALALAALSRKAWGRASDDLVTRLIVRYEEGQFLGETRTLALAALATEPGPGWFGAARNA
jgi:hypothetical protein